MYRKSSNLIINNFNQTMLIQSRTRYSTKKLSSPMASPIHPILTNNPQIQILSDQLLLISSSLPQQRPSSLNLIHWEKEKYRPNENENRIRIENHISLIKVCNERVRSRVKPIRRAQSIEPHHQPPPAYKQHYEQIRDTLIRQAGCSQALQSEEEPDSPRPAPSAPHSSIKYLHDLRKYTKIVQFISNRMEQRSHSVQMGFTSVCSQSLTSYPEKRPLNKQSSAVHKQPRFEGSLEKASCIMKKWKPASKAERIFSRTAETKSRSTTDQGRQKKAQRHLSMAHSTSLSKQPHPAMEM